MERIQKEKKEAQSIVVLKLIPPVTIPLRMGWRRKIMQLTDIGGQNHALTTYTQYGFKKDGLKKNDYWDFCMIYLIN